MIRWSSERLEKRPRQLANIIAGINEDLEAERSVPAASRDTRRDTTLLPNSDDTVALSVEFRTYRDVHQLAVRDPSAFMQRILRGDKPVATVDTFSDWRRRRKSDFEVEQDRLASENRGYHEATDKEAQHALAVIRRLIFAHPRTERIEDGDYTLFVVPLPTAPKSKPIVRLEIKDEAARQVTCVTLYVPGWLAFSSGHWTMPAKGAPCFASHVTFKGVKS